MENIRFGEMELKALFALEEQEAGMVSLAELKKKLGLSHIQARKLASRLVRKKRLIRLKRGIYLFAPMKAGMMGHWSEDALSSVPQLMAGREYYVGFWAALNHYGLTEQIPRTIQIVTGRQQRPFDALQMHFEFITARKPGEWKEEKIGNSTVRIATIEQLIIDCLALPGKCGGMKEACKALWEARKQMDWKKLKALASESKDAVRRRLGYACELFGIREMGFSKNAGWRWLDPSAQKKVLAKSAKWGLLLNVSQRELTEWKED